MDLMEVDDETEEEQPTPVVQGIADVMAVSVDWMNIRDYLLFGSINKYLRELSFQHVKQLTHKICIQTDIELYSTIKLIIFAKNGRQVLYKIACRDEILDILKYLLRAEVYPTELDIQGYNHGEGDAIMEWLHEFRSFRKVTMTDCSCNTDCVGLGRLPLQDIYHITPNAFLENKLSVNSLHIHANLPSQCVDQLTVLHSYNLSASEIFEKFKETLNMMVRCLYIRGVNRFFIPRNYLEALVNIMKVEELHLQCELHDFYSPRCADLKFSFKWEDTKSLISVKKLFYTAADKIESSTIIMGISSLFEAKDEMNIEFPTYRNTEDLVNTMDTLTRNLNRIETSNLVLSYTCQLGDEHPNYEKTCAKIPPFFKREGFAVLVSELDHDNHYTLEAICKEMHVKISITFLEPPPPLPAPSVQERRSIRMQWQLIPNHDDHRVVFYQHHLNPPL